MKGKLAGFVLGHDAARLLGAHLDKLVSVVELHKDEARLLPVAEWAKALFGKDAGRDEAPAGRSKAKATKKQLGLFGAAPAAPRRSSASSSRRAPARTAASGSSPSPSRPCTLADPRRSAGWTACWRARRGWGSR